MRRPLLLSLLVVLGATPAGVAQPQATPDSTCSYSRCALRVDYGWFNSRLVRGVSGETVARLGWFGTGVGVLLAGPDSAAHHAREYASRRRVADVLNLLGTAFVLLSVTQTDDNFVDGAPLFIAGTTLGLVALPLQVGFRRSLDRAVWWYNRDLPRP